MTLPVLGLAVTHASADDLLPLLGRLSRWCRPRLLDAALGRPAAMLASDPRAQVPGGVPVAVLVRRAEDLDMGCARFAARVLTTDEAVLQGAGDRGTWLPAAALPAGVRHLPPWVRARVRAARGLPAQPLLLTHDGVPHWQAERSLEPVAETHLPTAMATAAAAALTGTELAVPALAWGTPLVTDAATCAALAAVDGRDVLVVDGDDTARADAARRLAQDPPRAAALSWAGRRLAQRRHDLGATAVELARVLLPFPATRLGHGAMDELGTPAGARIRARYDEALAPLARPWSSP